MNALTQVIHRRQMFLPQIVEGLQHHGLLELMHHLFTDQRLLGGIEGFRFLNNALTQQVFKQLVIFRQPLGDRQIHAEVATQAGLETRNVPGFIQGVRCDVLINHRIDDIGADRIDGLADIGGIQQLVALLIDNLTLIVGDIVKLEQILTNIEVATFHLALGILDRLGNPRVLDGFAILHAQLLHHAGDSV